MTAPLFKQQEQLNAEDWRRLSDLAQEFEVAWRQTFGPALQDFIPAGDDSLRLRSLIELVRIDQEFRWERDQRRLLEEYLAQWPELSQSPEAMLELLLAECLTRASFDAPATQTELQTRFPELAARINLDQVAALAQAEKAQASTDQKYDSPTLIKANEPAVTSLPETEDWSVVRSSRRLGKLTGKRLGRYELRRVLGNGGMGTVYEAWDTELMRAVALKMPRPELLSDPTVLQRFMTEARSAAAIRHPNVCSTFDVGQIDGQYFLTMPLIDGVSLAAWLEQRDTTAVEAAQIIRKLASALRAVHDLGTRHRDIKASNVMIDRQGEPILMDFGLARLNDTATHVTDTGSMLGTPAYMAPEQIEEGAAAGDHRADIYSLGVLFYQMLTGRLPFVGPVTKVLVQIATQTPPSIASLCPDIDSTLADICHRAMARDPSNRYQSVADLESALSEWLYAASKTQPRVGQAFQPDPNASPTPAPQKSAPPKNESKTPQSKPIASVHVARPSGQARKPDLRWVAAAIFFALAAAIVIKISDRAELVINSKGEGVQVKVLQLAQPEQERTLTIGDNSVRVRSGQVEVVLTGANADEYEVVGDKITLKRFGKEVVEIKRRQMIAKSREGEAPAEPLASKSTGWHGWSADAPPPAIAPFDAEQAKQHQAAWAKYLGVPVEYTNSLGMKFRLIPPGEFTMGSTPEEIEEALKFVVNMKQPQDWANSEGPRHQVILTQPIYLGVHEVTQAECEKVMGQNPSHFAPMGAGKETVAGMDTTRHPSEMVSWNDATEFCAKLSEKEKLKPFKFDLLAGETVTIAGTGYRLPTEAEWEYACRAGTTTKYWNGDKDEDVARVGWFHTYAAGRTHVVGELKPNPFGLFDVHGNVYEWVQDGWELTYHGQFQEKPATDPSGPSSFPPPAGSPRVLKGGGWDLHASDCRASYRGAHDQPRRFHNVGFRVSLTVDAVRQALKVDGAKIVKPVVPIGANGNPVAEQGRSAWDDLDPAQIPEAERVPRQPEGLVAVLGQHRRRVWNKPLSSSVSPDGTQFTLTTEDGLYLFGRAPQQPARFFNFGVVHTSTTFLPNGRIAAFVYDEVARGHQLQIFAKPRDGKSLEKQTTTIANHNTNQIIHATASSDGRWLAAFDDYPTSIGLWRLGDVPPQRAAKFVLPTPDLSLPPFSFSPDANWFCFTDSSQGQSAIHLVDLRGDTPREATVLKADADEKSDAPAKGFQHATFLSDGRLATADRNGRAWFWKINDGEPQRVGGIRETGFLHAATQSLRLVIRTSHTTFNVWDLATDPPQLLGTSSSSFAINNLATLAIAPNGETVFTGHLNGAVHFWNVSQTGVTELDPLVPNPKFDDTFRQHVKVVDRFLCATLESARVGIWRPTRDGLQALPIESPPFKVLDASPVQRQLIVASAGGGTALLRCDADRVTPTRRLTGDNVDSAALSDEGRRFAIGRQNGMEDVLELWGWESDDLPARKLSEAKSPQDRFTQLAFVEAGRTLVERRYGGRIKIWDVKDDQLIPRTTLPQSYAFRQIAVAPDGQSLATVDGVTLELWNLKSDLTKPTTSFAIGGSGAVAFSPDGRRLAASFWENGASAGVQIINLASGVVEKRLTFPGRVHELTFTDDSRHLITGNANATIYVVRVP